MKCYLSVRNYEFVHIESSKMKISNVLNMFVLFHAKGANKLCVLWFYLNLFFTKKNK